MAEPFEVASVRIVGDAEDLLKEGERAFTELEKRGEEFAETVRAAWGGLVGEMLIVQTLAEALGISGAEAGKIITASLAGASEATNLWLDGMMKAQKMVESGKSGTVEAFDAMQRAAAAFGYALDPVIVDAMRRAIEEARVLGETTQQATQRFLEYARQAEESGRTTRQVGGEAQSASSGLEALVGNVRGVAVGMLRGLTVAALFAKTVSAVSRELRIASEEAMRLSDIQLRLDVATRAATRALGDQALTADEVRRIGEELAAAYGQFSVAAFEEVGVKASILQRQLGATRDQMEVLLRSTYVLAAVTGQDLGQAFSSITYAIQYGYTRGLKSLYVNMEDLERLAGKRWSQMTEEERLYNLTNYLMQEAAKYSEDLAAAQDTLASRTEQANRKQEEARRIFGNLIAHFKTGFKEFFAGIELAAAQLYFIIFDLLNSKIVPAVGAAFGAITSFAVSLGKIPEWIRQGLNPVEEFLKAMHRGIAAGATGALGELRKFQEGWLEGWGRLGEAEQDAQEAMRDAREEMLQDVERVYTELAEILDELVEREAQAARDLAEDLEDIDRNLVRRRADLTLDLVRDLQDIETEAARRRAEAQADFHNRELLEAEEHRLRMLELENRYLLDLEDAVRERDAKQVLLLQRRYNLERQQAEDRYTLDAAKRRQAHLEELVDIEIQRQRKRQERIVEYEQELADAALAAERKREDAHIRFAREIEQLRAQAAKRLEEIAKTTAAEIQLNDEAQAILRQRLEQHYRAQASVIEAFYNWYRQRIAELAAMTAAVRPVSERWESHQRVLKRSPGYWGRVHGYQYGGTLLATGPTLMRVGEGRPERVDITPLSRSPVPSPAVAGARGGKVEISIALDDGLTARIVEDTLGEMADVVLNLASRRTM